MAETGEDILLRRVDSDGVAHVTLNRPGAYNALSLALMRGLIEALRALEANPAARVVVLSGAGKGFCAGHDLKEMRANPSRAFYEDTFRTCSALMLTITRLRLPVIAAVHGIATAAGCQLVATCDLAVADETARFATPGVNIGLFCSTPMVALSRAVGRKTAMEMLLLGEMASAQAMRDAGLLNRVTPDGEALAEAGRMAAIIASKSPLVLKIGKEAFQAQLEMGLEQAYMHTSEVMVDNMLARDADEGIEAFLARRKPVWTGQ